MACYNGPNPVNDEDRLVIWKWAKEYGIDNGIPVEVMGDVINEKFFAGQARQEWITDIISGRKTPYKELVGDAWRKQANRRAAILAANNLSKRKVFGPIWNMMEGLMDLPRSVVTFGHGLVFPITHAGDLAFKPTSWDIWFKGTMDTYLGTFSKTHAALMENQMEREQLFPYALKSGLDVAPGSRPVGILSKVLKQEMSERSWAMLKVMRYYLWESQMKRRIKPIHDDMTSEEVGAILDYGKNIAKQANHATGSGEGGFATIARNWAFGPKLTQSKINRLNPFTGDPAETIKTYANWKSATDGEKAVAWIRLNGAAQYTITKLAFLAINGAALSYFGSKQKINFTNPSKADWLEFKGYGLEGYIPGMQTEIHTLAKILATSWMTKQELHGQPKFMHEALLGGQYLMGKSSPQVERGLELGLGQNYRGQPLPWSKEKGTPKNPKLDWAQYAATVGPIPLEGPVRYFYDHLKQSGASSKEALSITRGLIIMGLGATGVHVQEEPTPAPAK